ncbi:MAG TPA: hypothetical protein VFU93_08215 [Acidimicrobiales bacterium]|nr:hypothetical protein [Acidimicrobiales bacterium]
MKIRLVLAAVGLAALSSWTPAHAATYEPGIDLFAFDDARITESSGIVASSVRDGVYFTHNDSGDAPRFFAVDDRGCTLASYDLAGFDVESFKDSHDVEDIARGPFAGTSSLWLADIGDNNHRRSDIAVLRVDEPQSNASAVRASDTCPTPAAAVVTATTYRLAYPDTPHDAETLLADPATGQLFIVTKTPLGQASVYAAPLALRADAVNVLELVGSIVFPPSATYDRDPATIPGAGQQNAFDVAGRLMSTGGDVAPARDRVVVRTYADAWEWVLPAGASIGEVLTTTVPTQLALRYDRQGEAIAYTRDGSSLLTTSEDAHSIAHLYIGR